MTAPNEVYDTIEAALIEFEYGRSAFYDGDAQALADAERAKRALAYIRTQREQDAGQWQPVPQSLEYDLITYAIRTGELPAEYRICRRVPTPAPVAPQEDK